MEDQGQALQFGTEIELNEGGFQLLAPGVYEMEIMKNPDNSKQFQGSAKMCACPMLGFQLQTKDVAGNTGSLNKNLIMNTKMIGFITEFLLGFDPSLKPGDKLNPNWSNMVGMKAVGKVKIRKYKKQDGSDAEANEVEKFFVHGSDEFKAFYNPLQAEEDF